MNRLTLFLLVAVAPLLGACASFSGPEIDDVVGEWQKDDDRLPPVHLLITRDGSALSARVRLSGIERMGTAAVDGRRLILTLTEPTDVVEGEFTSSTELMLQLRRDGEPYRLLKANQSRRRNAVISSAPSGWKSRSGARSNPICS